MKKTLIALAALAATASFAQSSVTIYGNVDIGYGTATTKSANRAVNDKTVGVVDGTQAPNRIGFRGVEDLGGGMTAGFVLEQGISPVSSNGWNLRKATSAQLTPNGGGFSSATMRAGNVFVGGGFGEVRVGTMNRSAYSVSSKSVIIAEDFGGEGHTLAATRQTGVQYTSPSFSGVTVQIQYGAPHGQRITQETMADNSSGLRTDNSKVVAGSVNYNQGPLWVGAAYEYQDLERVANAAATTNAYGGAVPVGTALNRTEKLYTLGGSYDFGVAKAVLTYVKRDQDTAGEAKSVNVGVTIPFGAVELGALYTKWDADNAAGTQINDVKGYQLQAKYNLSKRTNVYLFRGYDKDSAVAAATLSERTRTVVGVHHSF